MKRKKIFLTSLAIAAIATQSISTTFAFDYGSQGLIHNINNLEKQATHAGTVGQNQLQHIISSADMMISNRITSLNILSTRVQNDTRLSSTEKSSLSSDIQTIISNLNTLKAKIDADTDAATAKADAKQIVTNFHVYIAFEPKTRLLITLNNLQTITTNLQALVPQLQNFINTLQSQGKDISGLTPLVNDISSQLQTINTTLTNDIATVQNVSITTDPKTTFTQVKQDLQDIVHVDFQKIRSDISQMRTIIKGFKPNKPTGAVTVTSIPTTPVATTTATPTLTVTPTP